VTSRLDNFNIVLHFPVVQPRGKLIYHLTYASAYSPHLSLIYGLDDGASFNRNLFLSGSTAENGPIDDVGLINPCIVCQPTFPHALDLGHFYNSQSILSSSTAENHCVHWAIPGRICLFSGRFDVLTQASMFSTALHIQIVFTCR
jgi:hypothetical protein